MDTVLNIPEKCDILKAVIRTISSFISFFISFFRRLATCIR